jgi:hypothetical protein
MDFGFIDTTIILANQSDSRHFPPSGAAVIAMEPSLTTTIARRNLDSMLE